METTTFSTRFSLGQILVTPQAEQRLESGEVRAALRRHARGDWGEATPQQVTENERSLREGGSVVSVFRDGGQRRFCVLTNGQRSATLVVQWADE